MPLLNYRTEVSASRTASQVQALLVKAGARGVGMIFDEHGVLTGMNFAVLTPYGRQTFVLPVNVAAVQAVLERQRVDRSLRTAAHAERVAWRIVKDWIEAQLALLATEMVTLDQIMLPYMDSGDGSTVYDHFVGQRLALESGNGERR